MKLGHKSFAVINNLQQQHAAILKMRTTITAQSAAFQYPGMFFADNILRPVPAYKNM